MSQQQVQLPVLAAFGSVVLAPQAILAIDASDYTPGKKDRNITAYIVGPHTIELYDDDADAFKLWWDQVTGQSRIQPAPPGLKIT